MFYVGQTGRSFNTRFKEHLPKNKQQPQKYSVPQHIMDHNHTVQNPTDNMQILYVCNKGPLMNSLEEAEIFKATRSYPNSILNEKLNYTSHPIFNLLFKQ
jgi:hypothetical protein